MNTSVQFVKKIKGMNNKSAMANVIYLIAVLMALYLSPGNAYEDKMDGMGGLPFLNYIMLICFCYHFMKHYISNKNDNVLNIKGGFYAIAKTGNLDLKKIFTYIYVRFLPYAAIIAAWAIVRGIIDSASNLYIFAAFAFIIPAVVMLVFYGAYKYIAEHRRYGGVAIITVPAAFLILVLSTIGILATYLFGSMVLTAVIDACLDNAMNGDAIILKCYSYYALNIAASFGVIIAALAVSASGISKKVSWIALGVAGLIMASNIAIGANCYVHTELDKITVSDFSGENVYRFSDIDNVVVLGTEEIEIKAVMSDGRSVTILDDMYMVTESFSNKYSDCYSFALDLLTEMKKSDVIITIKDQPKLEEDAKDKGVLEVMKAIEAL